METCLFTCSICTNDFNDSLQGKFCTKCNTFYCVSCLIELQIHNDHEHILHTRIEPDFNTDLLPEEPVKEDIEDQIHFNILKINNINHRMQEYKQLKKKRTGLEKRFYKDMKLEKGHCEENNAKYVHIMSNLEAFHEQWKKKYDELKPIIDAHLAIITEKRNARQLAGEFRIDTKTDCLKLNGIMYIPTDYEIAPYLVRKCPTCCRNDNPHLLGGVNCCQNVVNDLFIHSDELKTKYIKMHYPENQNFEIKNKIFTMINLVFLTSINNEIFINKKRKQELETLENLYGDIYDDINNNRDPKQNPKLKRLDELRNKFNS